MTPVDRLIATLADAVAQAEAVRATRDARTINLNDRVLVDLTAAGARMYRAYYRTEPATYTDVSLTLWEVANIFGSALYNGTPETPFESMELRLVP